MLQVFRRRQSSKDRATLQALDRTLARIEFDLDGRVLDANENFLKAMNYELSDIVGRHHGMFVDPLERASREYAEFWSALNRGEPHRTQFRRIAKGGREIWIEATYNPVLDRNQLPCRVVKYATDITEQRMKLADLNGQAQAIRKSQAVIEFALDGTILAANENFLNTLGYALPDIQGRHHRMFVAGEYGASAEYQLFWEALRRGEFQAGQFNRFGKGGKSIWIEATYNLILDAYDRPLKVVKFATDITHQVEVMADLRRIIHSNFAEIDKSIDMLRCTTMATSRATSETSTNVSEVSAASKELTASIAEIAQRMMESSSASDDAVTNTGTADEATHRLSSSAEAMGGIVQVIEEIAEQINMLALNATIEAARAGSAGRGFAVVAAEVKNLANQVAAATSRITTEITGIQSVSSDVVAVLGKIKHSIGLVRECVGATASAVRKQESVMRSVTANMDGAAWSVDLIESTMNDVNAAISDTASAILETREAARVLAR